MINLIGLSSSGGSGGSTSIGNGAASTNGNGLNLSPTQVTVSYQGKKLTLQDFVDTITKNFITNKLTASEIKSMIAKVDELSANSIRGNVVYIGKTSVRAALDELQDQIDELKGKS